jgi:hypothetical protein
MRRKFPSLMKKFLVFGDSWPYGSELDFRIEKPFPNLFAEQNQLDLGAYCVPSTGIPHLVIQLEKAINDGFRDCIGLFCLSSTSRSITYQDNQWQEIHVNNTDPSSVAYFKYIHSLELDDFTSNCYILALQKICQQYNIDDYYVSCWSELNLYLPGIDKSKFFNEGKTTLVDILGCIKDRPYEDISIDSNHPTIYPKKWHPNYTGHQIIANKLNNWINIQ